MITFRGHEFPSIDEILKEQAKQNRDFQFGFLQGKYDRLYRAVELQLREQAEREEELYADE